MEINELKKEIYKNAIEKGFYENEGTAMLDANSLFCTPEMRIRKQETLKHIFFAQKIALIHSELSEALEADRENKRCTQKSIDHMNQIGWGVAHFRDNIKNTVEDELADVIIRVLDLCAHLNIDIEKHIELKMKYNSSREYKHGKEY